MENRLDKLSKLKWPKPGKKVDRFMSITLEEYQVATQMEKLAYQHIIFAKDLRSGKELNKKKLKTYADERKKCASKFEKLWWKRNKPSRLQDNLNGFKAGVKEALSLAK